MARPIAIPMTTSMHAPCSHRAGPGWDRLSAYGRGCPFGTAAPDMLESGRLRGRRTPRGAVSSPPLRVRLLCAQLWSLFSWRLIGSDSETREMQAKCRMERLLSYRRSALVRNGFFSGPRDDLPLEPASREQPRGLRACAPTHDDPRGPLVLGLERLDSGPDQLGFDALTAEVEANERVALAAFGERSCASACEALVVEETDLLQLFQRLLELRR